MTRIWRQRAELNTIVMDDVVIRACVTPHPRISGRDVKNLLKLDSFVAKRDGRPVNGEILEFALQRRPREARSRPLSAARDTPDSGRL